MALKPLYDEMSKRVLASKNIFIDESLVKLWEAVKCKKAYMWVILGGYEDNTAYRIYEFKEDRCHHNAPSLVILLAKG